jgi:hypothetical protein
MQPSVHEEERMMNARTWITPLTLGSFLLVGVTGVLMFFNVKSGLVTVTHEWLSLTFVAGAALHIWLNWKAILATLRRGRSRLIVGAFAMLLALALLSIGHEQPAPHRQGEAMRQVTTVLLNTPISTLAVLTDCSTEEVRHRLGEQGIRTSSDTVTLTEVARQNNTHPMHALAAMLWDAGPKGRAGGRPGR